MSKRKIEESNTKRLESLRRQAEEFKQKKFQIRNDLLNPDALKNKKIIFEDNEEEVEEKQKMMQFLDDDKEDTDDDSEEETELDENAKINTNETTKTKEKPKVQIDTNLKDLFCSSDVFKFQFSNIEDKPSESSSDSELDESDADSMFNQPVVQKSIEKKELKPAHVVTPKSDSKLNKFLPDFTGDHEIKDALVYFFSTKTDEELREDWPSKREALVQEYKKKHKRMIRIKKHKENEKLFSWKIKKTSNK